MPDYLIFLIERKGVNFETFINRHSKCVFLQKETGYNKQPVLYILKNP